MAEPLDADQVQPRVWQCLDCNTRIHLHDDPDHDSHTWTRDFIAEHEYVHRTHLEAHNGDRAMMRLALKYPHLHTAIVQVHGPAADLHPDHRAEILRAAGIDDCMPIDAPITDEPTDTEVDP